jgi:hypothetical protein
MKTSVEKISQETVSLLETLNPAISTSKSTYPLPYQQLCQPSLWSLLEEKHLHNDGLQQLSKISSRNKRHLLYQSLPPGPPISWAGLRPSVRNCKNLRGVLSGSPQLAQPMATAIGFRFTNHREVWCQAALHPPGEPVRIGTDRETPQLKGRGNPVASRSSARVQLKKMSSLR